MGPPSVAAKSLWLLLPSNRVTSMRATQTPPVLLHPQAWPYPAYPTTGVKRLSPDSSSASSCGNWHHSGLFSPRS